MNNNLNHNRTLRLKPYYIFGTVALATLLALLAVMHPRGNQFIVESLVTVDGSRLRNVDDAARDQLVQSKFSSPETVAAVLETLPPDALGHAGLDGLAIESLADLVSHKLQVQVERVEGSATENIHVRYASKSQAFAIGLVNAIATHVVENYSERESSPQYNNALKRADRQIQSLKQKLTDLRNAQKRQLQEGVSAQLPSHRAQDEVTAQPDGSTEDVPLDPSSPTDVVSSSDEFSSDDGSSDDESIWEGSATEWAESPTAATAETMTKNVPIAPTLPEVYELNSHWSAISNALSQARLDLEEALDKMTPSHPVVVRLTTEIKKLEQLLSETPQFIRSEKPAPTPSLTPAADLEAPSSGHPRLDLGPPHSSGGLLAPGNNLIQTVGFSAGSSPAGIAESPEFKALTAQIDGLKDQLAKEINDRNALAASPPTGTARVSSEAELIDSHCPVIVPFDLLTLFLPAGVLALVAAIARTPTEPPAVLFSVSDAKKSLRSAVIGTISTKNGPGIPAAEPGGPPTIVRWLVFASEVICVAAAVLVLISIFQIPGYASQFFSNPFSAFVTSFDFVVQFIGQT